MNHVHSLSRPASPPSSALPSPPSSPGSSMYSLPSSVFNSLSSSPPLLHTSAHEHSLIIPSLSLDNGAHASEDPPVVDFDALGTVQILVVGARGSGKAGVAEALLRGHGARAERGSWEVAPGLGRVLVAGAARNVRVVEVEGFVQTDEASCVAEPILEAVQEPFVATRALLSDNHPPDAALRELVASPQSKLYTAAVLLVSTPPTPTEDAVLAALAPYVPVIPLLAPRLPHPSPAPPHFHSHPRSRGSSRSRSRPAATHACPSIVRAHTSQHLHQLLFRAPSALPALRAEAADRFLAWREAERARSITSAELEGWASKADPLRLPLDPLHLPSLAFLALGLIRRVGRRWWAAFCAGLGVGVVLGSVWR